MPSNYCPYTLPKIISAMKEKSYSVFEKEYDLNIVGIRTAETESNQFNDWITMFHKRASGVWAFYTFQATTDPGLFWRQNPENINGVAILKPNQWKGMWTLGKHQGKYEAFVQAKPITVYRDSNKNSTLDTKLKEDTGIFGINGHRAKENGTSTNVDKWSAGCQVWADSDDHDFAMVLAKRQIEKGIGNSFTYTLLEEHDIK